jgi:hypothetical protein
MDTSSCPALQISECCLERSDIDVIRGEAKSISHAADKLNRLLLVPEKLIWPKNIGS